MREHILYLAAQTFGGTQSRLADYINLPKLTLSRYMTGRTCNGKDSDEIALDKQRTSIVQALNRHGFPTEPPDAD